MKYPKLNFKRHDNNIYTWVLENTWLKRGDIIDFGFGNGYISIPNTHPLFGEHYDDDRLPCGVHGGWTFCEEQEVEGIKCWVFGFDTCHGYDSLVRWPDSQSVSREIERVVEFFQNIK